MTQYNLPSAQQSSVASHAARDLLSGALNEAIRWREEKDEGLLLPELDSSPSKRSAHAHSPSKLSGKAVSRRRRRKDEEEEESRAFHHTFVMKLFDRSVDLAQFRPDTPLYPVCRAWMRNEPSNVNQGPRARTPTPPPPAHRPPLLREELPPPLKDETQKQNRYSDDDEAEDEEEDDEAADDSMADVYVLPTPVPLSEDGGTGRCPRLPPPEPPLVLEGLHMDLEQTDDTPPAILLSNHMVRWWGVKKAWKHAALENEKRYEKSMTILKDLFEK